MNPRSLRHRLEKLAKALVLIQKYAPKADCVLDEIKGEYGYIVVHLNDSATNSHIFHTLGKGLESRGYRFKQKKSPWLGQITYSGKAEDKSSIAITLPVIKDRLAIVDDLEEENYSFK